MNFKYKSLLIALLLLFAVTIVGCGAEETPYQRNDAEKFTVSVKYDANGGDFTTNNTLVIVDSYDPQENGGSIALLEPDNPQRGKNAFKVSKPGYFLAGWYTQRTETAEGFTYAGKWDFSTDILTVDPAGTYSAEEPVLTLYAAWVPLFEIAYYDLETGELLKTVTYNPNEGLIKLPKWDESTGTILMNNVPQREGYTFAGAYLDSEGKQPLTAETIQHPGVIDEESATAQNTTLHLYTDWDEGQWYRIYSAEQFIKNANVNGCYDIYADLDFSEKIWPTALMYGTYNGEIRGNGYSFRNISLSQTNNSKITAGLFGQLSEQAKLHELTFENVTFTIKSGTRVAGTSYGLLIGSASAEAEVERVAVKDSILQIDSGCYFGTDDYVIGLICGSGSLSVETEGVTCQAVGDAPETVNITVTDGIVTVEFISQ